MKADFLTVNKDYRPEDGLWPSAIGSQTDGATVNISEYQMCLGQWRGSR